MFKDDGQPDGLATKNQEHIVSQEDLLRLNKDFASALEKRGNGKVFCETIKNLYDKLPSGLRVLFRLQLPKEPKFATEERLRESLMRAGILKSEEEECLLVVQSPFMSHEQSGDSSSGRMGLAVNRSAIQRITESPEYDLEKHKTTGKTVWSLDINPTGTFSYVGLDYFFVCPTAVMGISCSADKSILLSPIAIEREDEVVPVHEWCES